jgi:hypothetical protein
MNWREKMSSDLLQELIDEKLSEAEREFRSRFASMYELNNDCTGKEKSMRKDGNVTLCWGGDTDDETEEEEEESFCC